MAEAQQLAPLHRERAARGVPHQIVLHARERALINATPHTGARWMHDDGLGSTTSRRLYKQLAPNALDYSIAPVLQSRANEGVYELELTRGNLVLASVARIELTLDLYVDYAHVAVGSSLDLSIYSPPVVGGRDPPPPLPSLSTYRLRYRGGGSSASQEVFFERLNAWRLAIDANGADTFDARLNGPYTAAPGRRLLFAMRDDQQIIDADYAAERRRVPLDEVSLRLLFSAPEYTTLVAELSMLLEGAEVRAALGVDAPTFKKEARPSDETRIVVPQSTSANFQVKLNSFARDQGQYLVEQLDANDRWEVRRAVNVTLAPTKPVSRHTTANFNESIEFLDDEARRAVPTMPFDSVDSDYAWHRLERRGITSTRAWDPMAVARGGTYAAIERRPRNSGVYAFVEKRQSLLLNDNAPDQPDYERVLAVVELDVSPLVVNDVLRRGETRAYNLSDILPDADIFDQDLNPTLEWRHEPFGTSAARELGSWMGARPRFEAREPETGLYTLRLSGGRDARDAPYDDEISMRIDAEIDDLRSGRVLLASQNIDDTLRWHTPPPRSARERRLTQDELLDALRARNYAVDDENVSALSIIEEARSDASLSAEVREWAAAVSSRLAALPARLREHRFFDRSVHGRWLTPPAGTGVYTGEAPYATPFSYEERSTRRSDDETRSVASTSELTTRGRPFVSSASARVQGAPLHASLFDADAYVRDLPFSALVGPRLEAFRRMYSDTPVSGETLLITDGAAAQGGFLLEPVERALRFDPRRYTDRERVLNGVEPLNPVACYGLVGKPYYARGVGPFAQRERHYLENGFGGLGLGGSGGYTLAESRLDWRNDLAARSDPNASTHTEMHLWACCRRPHSDEGCWRGRALDSSEASRERQGEYGHVGDLSQLLSDPPRRGTVFLRDNIVKDYDALYVRILTAKRRPDYETALRLEMIYNARLGGRLQVPYRASTPRLLDAAERFLFDGVDAHTGAAVEPNSQLENDLVATLLDDAKGQRLEFWRPDEEAALSYAASRLDDVLEPHDDPTIRRFALLVEAAPLGRPLSFEEKEVEQAASAAEIATRSAIDAAALVTERRRLAEEARAQKAAAAARAADARAHISDLTKAIDALKKRAVPIDENKRVTRGMLARTFDALATAAKSIKASTSSEPTSEEETAKLAELSNEKARAEAAVQQAEQEDADRQRLLKEAEDFARHAEEEAQKADEERARIEREDAEAKAAEAELERKKAEDARIAAQELEAELVRREIQTALAEVANTKRAAESALLGRISLEDSGLPNLVLRRARRSRTSVPPPSRIVDAQLGAIQKDFEAHAETLKRADDAYANDVRAVDANVEAINGYLERVDVQRATLLDPKKFREIAAESRALVVALRQSGKAMLDIAAARNSLVQKQVAAARSANALMDSLLSPQSASPAPRYQPSAAADASVFAAAAKDSAAALAQSGNVVADKVENSSWLSWFNPFGGGGGASPATTADVADATVAVATASSNAATQRAEARAAITDAAVDSKAVLDAAKQLAKTNNDVKRLRADHAKALKVLNDLPSKGFEEARKDAAKNEREALVRLADAVAAVQEAESASNIASQQAAESEERAAKERAEAQEALRREREEMRLLEEARQRRDAEAAAAQAVGARAAQERLRLEKEQAAASAEEARRTTAAASSAIAASARDITAENEFNDRMAEMLERLRDKTRNERTKAAPPTEVFPVREFVFVGETPPRRDVEALDIQAWINDALGLRDKVFDASESANVPSGYEEAKAAKSLFVVRPAKSKGADVFSVSVVLPEFSSKKGKLARSAASSAADPPEIARLLAWQSSVSVAPGVPTVPTAPTAPTEPTAPTVPTAPTTTSALDTAFAELRSDFASALRTLGEQYAAGVKPAPEPVFVPATQFSMTAYNNYVGELIKSGQAVAVNRPGPILTLVARSLIDNNVDVADDGYNKARSRGALFAVSKTKGAQPMFVLRMALLPILIDDKGNPKRASKSEQIKDEAVREHFRAAFNSFSAWYAKPES